MIRDIEKGLFCSGTPARREFGSHLAEVKFCCGPVPEGDGSRDCLDGRTPNWNTHNSHRDRSRRDTQKPRRAHARENNSVPAIVSDANPQSERLWGWAPVRLA